MDDLKALERLLCVAASVRVLIERQRHHERKQQEQVSGAVMLTLSARREDRSQESLRDKAREGSMKRGISLSFSDFP